MKNKAKNKTLYIKIGIISLIIIALVVLSIMVYNMLFSSNDSSRYSDIENHVFTDNEKKSVSEKLKGLDNVSNVDIYSISKTIRIIVTLSEDIELDKVKEVANESLKEIKTENLEFYDVEIFVESKNKDSEVYPRIGYRNNDNSEFVW